MTGSRNEAFFLMAFGFVVWMSAFSFLYAAQATGCVLAWDRVAVGPFSLLRVTLVMLWLAHMFVLTRLYIRCRREVPTAAAADPLDLFLWRAATVLTLAAIAAAILLGLALLLPAMCQ